MGDRTNTPNSIWERPIRSHPNGARMIGPALSRAQALVTIVRDEDAASVAKVIDNLNWCQMPALVVVLAALVPDDVPLADLKAWWP